jgi:hypothetical protein
VLAVRCCVCVRIARSWPAPHTRARSLSADQTASASPFTHTLSHIATPSSGSWLGLHLSPSSRSSCARCCCCCCC